jgi:hypothetical protein
MSHNKKAPASPPRSSQLFDDDVLADLTRRVKNKCSEKWKSRALALLGE